MHVPAWASAAIVAFHYKLALSQRELKWYDEALVNIDKALALNPDYAEAHAQRGEILWSLKRYDEALASCDKAIELRPDYAKAYQYRGAMLLDKGDMAGAQQALDKTLAIKPDFAKALFTLAAIRKYKNTDHPDVQRIKSIIDDPLTPLSDQDSLYFALGKIYDDCGRYDEAFACYQQANQMRNERISYNPGKVTKHYNHIISVFNKDLLAHPLLPDNPSTPVFIIGMPRSGTTLAAQILSNHPSIATAGELPTIGEFVLRLPRLIKMPVFYPKAVHYIKPPLAKRLAGDYEKRLRRDAGSEVPFVIDKQPINSIYLGLITMLFPKARIIHCMRHPLDTALSNYFQRFPLDYNYAFDLQNIGQFYMEYTKLMAYWHKALPVPILDVRYEDMIANTEQTTRRMLDFIGLPWDARCLSPHTNPAPVETASNWQVRQPIYSKSVERWRHYEKHLGPLKEIMKDAISAYSDPATPDTSPRAQNA